MTTSVPLRLPVEDKLDALRKLDPAGHWESLDSARYCTLCDHVITGRQIEVAGGTRAHGPLRLECPTDGCIATPVDWISPADRPARGTERREEATKQSQPAGAHRAGFVRIDARTEGISITHNGSAAVVRRTRSGRVGTLLELAELNEKPAPRGRLLRWIMRNVAPVATDSRSLLGLLRPTRRAHVQPLS